MTEDIEITVTGMTCGGCTSAVERALSRMDGVTAVTVELSPGLARVTTDGTVGADKLSAVIIKAGYGVGLEDVPVR